MSTTHQLISPFQMISGFQIDIHFHITLRWKRIEGLADRIWQRSVGNVLYSLSAWSVKPYFLFLLQLPFNLGSLSTLHPAIRSRIFNLQFPDMWKLLFLPRLRFYYIWFKIEYSVQKCNTNHIHDCLWEAKEIICCNCYYTIVKICRVKFSRTLIIFCSLTQQTCDSSSLH